MGTGGGEGSACGVRRRGRIAVRKLNSPNSCALMIGSRVRRTAQDENSNFCKFFFAPVFFYPSSDLSVSATNPPL